MAQRLCCFLGIALVLGACREVGLDDAALASWYVTENGGVVSLGLVGIDGCAPLSSRLTASWNGTPLAVERAGSEWVHYPNGNGHDPTPFDLCIGYSWKSSAPLPASDSDVLELTDGDRTLSVSDPRALGEFSWLSPPDAVVTLPQTAIEFSVGLAPGSQPRASNFWVTCVGPWEPSSQEFSLMDRTGPAGRGYQIVLQPAGSRPPPAGTYSCAVTASTYLEPALCPARHCVLDRYGALVSAAVPHVPITFEFTVR